MSDTTDHAAAIRTSLNAMRDSINEGQAPKTVHIMTIRDHADALADELRRAKNDRDALRVAIDSALARFDRALNQDEVAEAMANDLRRTKDNPEATA